MPYNFVPDSFHTGVTAEALRAKIEQKSTISHQRGHLDPSERLLVENRRFCSNGAG